MNVISRVAILAGFSLFAATMRLPAAAISSPPVDHIDFGDPVSEGAHQFSDRGSESGRGGLGQPMRRLLPLSSPTWKGGDLSFTLKVVPDAPIYVTARFWGSDVTDDRLVLFCEGKQIGWYHLGEIETLDAGNEDGTPAYNGRFFYHTSPLPTSITQGKTELHFRIRAMGRIWGYGSAWAQYQKDMTKPSRGIYALYTHTDGCFVPPAGEVQGPAMKNPPARTESARQVLDAVKARENSEIDHELVSSSPLNEIEAEFIARAWHVKWSNAYQKPEAVQKVAEALDHLYALWKADPKVIDNAPGAYNGGWLGFGPIGDAVRLLSVPLQPLLDDKIKAGSGGQVTRRVAWSEMLQASRDKNRTHRREYSNQTMIVDLNAYRDNRGVAAIDPSHALPEAQMLDYLYQSVGIEPWLGSDTNHGPEKPLGDDYWQLTAKSLTRELGYVGYYGEVIDWVTSIYDATRPVTATGFGPGDAKIKKQLIKVAKARAIFRYPMLDADGNRAMRIEGVVGWRDEGHYPGNIAYAERPSWDGTPLYVVAQSLDPMLVGYAQQMFDDNQFFATVEKTLKEGGLRVTAGMLDLPDQYDAVMDQAKSSARLPMSWDQPDFAWADEEDGVVALKHGGEILYASLYWRARFGINSLARIHFMTPTFDRLAVVREREEFTPSGMTYTYPDWVNMAFGNGGVRYPEEMHPAMAGDTIPIAQIPDNIKFHAGDESPYAGRADFYLCQYSGYTIEMNGSKDKPHTLEAPPGVTASSAKDLVSGQSIKIDAATEIAPRSTLILWLGAPNSNAETSSILNP
jgi:hypothetical protein